MAGLTVKTIGQRGAPAPTVSLVWRSPVTRRPVAIELRGARLGGGAVQSSTPDEAKRAAADDEGASGLRGRWTLYARVSSAEGVTLTAVRSLGRQRIEVYAEGPAPGGQPDAAAWRYRWAVARKGDSRRGQADTRHDGTAPDWGRALAQALARARLAEGHGCELLGITRAGASVLRVADELRDAQRGATGEAEREEAEADAADLARRRKTGPRKAARGEQRSLLG